MSHTTWDLFVTFFKIGALSFGGGPPTIPMMHKELVGKTDLSNEQFVDGLALGNALPGPILTNMAVYTGLKLGGAAAAAVGVIGAILPSVFLMGGAVILFTYYSDVPLVQSAMKAIRPAIIAMLAFTIYKLAPNSIFSISQAAVAGAILIALIAFNLHPALGIICAGVAGMIIYR